MIRRLTSLLLALTLALTSVTMAVARGQTRLAGEVVICSGAGVTTITVDQNGQPVHQIHICPDMVLGLMAALDAPAPVVLRPQTRAEALLAHHATREVAQAVPQPKARSPPVG